jgi:hypothetical protein
MPKRKHIASQLAPKKPLIARYRDLPLERLNANPLIRALPAMPDKPQLQKLLTRVPKFTEEDRLADPSVKEHRLQELFRLYIGLPRVADLASSLYTMMCEGYIGRVPDSLEDHEARQRLYERRQEGEFFDDEEIENGAEFTAALVGIPGIGKTKAMKRATAPFRCVIYHPELDIHQIPVLYVQMPYKGVSVNALANAIIRGLHNMFPQGNYYDTYLAHRSDAEERFMDAVDLLTAHYVGLLIVDESQNRDHLAKNASRELSAAVRGQTPLMTMLINATNELKVPMLLCGTPELNDIYGERMSLVRRKVGRGMKPWGPLTLPKMRDGKVVYVGEFDIFLKILWRCQVTKTPFALTPEIRNTFYFYTQGISDIVIKLFHDVQLRAVRDGGDEIVDLALVHDVANTELKAMSKLTKAMRKKDTFLAAQASDLAAYLDMDPWELTFGQARPDTDEFPEEPPQADDEEDYSKEAEEAAKAPKEVVTGRKKSVRSGKKPEPPKRADHEDDNSPTEGVAPPSIKPVGGLDEVFSA